MPTLEYYRLGQSYPRVKSREPYPRRKRGFSVALLTENRYWVNDGADGDWENASNWSDTDNGTGGAGTPTRNSRVYFTSSVNDNCTLSAHSYCKSLSFSGYTGTFDADVYNVEALGGIDVDAGSMTFYMGSGTWTLGTELIITNVSIFAPETSTVVTSGEVREINQATWYLENLTVPAGSTVIVLTDSYLSGLLTVNGEVTELLGESTFEGGVSIGSGGLLDCGVNSPWLYKSLTNNGEIRSTTTVFCYGDISAPNDLTVSGTGLYNAILRLSSYAGATDLIIQNDVIFEKRVDFHSNNASYPLTVLNTTNNPDLTFKGDAVITESGGGSVSWTKGTGTNIFSGSADQDVDFNGESVEDISVDKSGGTATFTGDVTTDSFTVEVTCAGNVDFGASQIIGVAGDVYMTGSGTVDLGDATSINVAGSWTAYDQGTLIAGTSVITLTGTSKTIRTHSKVVYDVIIDTGASYTVLFSAGASHSLQVKGTLVSDGSGFIVPNFEITSSGEVTGTSQIHLGYTGDQTAIIDGPCSAPVTSHQQEANDTTTISGSSTLSGLFTFEVTTGTGDTTLRFGASTPTFAGGILIDITRASGTKTIDLLTNNASLVVQDDFQINDAGGIVWSKGSGTITFSGSSSHNIDFDGKAVEDIVIDKSGGTATFTGDVDTDSLSVPGTCSGSVDFGDTSLAIGITGDATFDGTGTIDGGNATITCGGNFDNKDQATWTAGTNTWVMTGTSKTWLNLFTTNGHVYKLELDSGATIATSSDYLYVDYLTVTNGTYTHSSTQDAAHVYIDLDVAASGVVSIGSGRILRVYGDITNAGEISGDGTLQQQHANPELSLTISGAGTFSAAYIHQSATYLSTCTIGSALTFTGDATWAQIAAPAYVLTVDNSGNYNLDFKGDVTLTATGGSVDWTKGTGTITLSGAANQNIDFNGEAVEDIVIDKSAGTATFTGDVDTDSFNVPGTCSGSVDFGDSTLAIGIAGDATFDGTGTLDLGNSTVTCGGNWDDKDQTTITASAHTIVLTGTSKTLTPKGISHGTTSALTISGTITHSTNGDVSYGTVTVDASKSLTMTQTLSAVTALIVNGTLTINGNYLYANTAAVTIGNSGLIDGSATFYMQASIGTPRTLDITGGGQITVATFIVRSSYTLSGGTYGSATVEILNYDTGATTKLGAAASQTLIFTGDVTFTCETGETWTLDCATNSPDLEFRGNTIINDYGTLTYNKGGGTISFTQGASQIIDLDDQATEEIIINKSAGTVQMYGGVVCDAFTGTSTGSGIFDPNGQTIETVGNCSWAAAFVFDSDAMCMNGCTWVVGGNFTANGQILNASATWYLQVHGTAVASGAGAVAYSDASGAGHTAITATGWTDNNNNSNWDFGGAAVIIVNRIIVMQ